MDNRPYIARRKTSSKAAWTRSSTSRPDPGARAVSSVVGAGVDEPEDKKQPFDDSSDLLTSAQEKGDGSDDDPLSPLALRPGAVAVRGVTASSLNDEDDRSADSGSGPLQRGGRRSGGVERSSISSAAASAVSDSSSSPLVVAEPVAAYKVPEIDDRKDDDGDGDETSPEVVAVSEAAKAAAEAEKMEQIRKQIIDNAAEAVVVTASDDDKSIRRRNRIIVLLALVAASIGIAVGVAVPLTSQKNSNSSTVAPTPSPEVLASVAYQEAQGDGGFAATIFAETRQGVFFGKQTDTTTGSVGLINCVIKGCTLNATNCVSGKDYEPGCCLGANCPIDSKCGNVCPKPPKSCYPTNPQNKNCTKSACYTCNKVNGEDIYELSDLIMTIDCLQVGTSIRDSNQETYKWAIVCGLVVEGSYNQGGHNCIAVRKGADYTDDSGGILASYVSCNLIALALCNCGPPDMNTEGLPAPTVTCSTNGTCPIRCEASGTGGVSTICKHFPGNVTWWEGQNAFNHSRFLEGLAAPNFTFEIYIKGQH